MMNRVDSPAALYAHVRTRDGRGAQSPADRLVGGGVLGRKPLHPNAPRTEVSNGGPTP